MIQTQNPWKAIVNEDIANLESIIFLFTIAHAQFDKIDLKPT